MINFSNFFITLPKTFQLSLRVAGKRNTDFVSFVTILPVFAAKRPDCKFNKGVVTLYKHSRYGVIVLTDKEHLAILLMLVKNLKQPRLRCGAIKVLSYVMAENSLPQTTKDNLRLCSEVFSGLASSLRNSESDGFTEITLIELGLSSSVQLRDRRVYEDYSIVLPVVGLVQNKSTSVKLHIAQTVRILFVKFFN